MEINRVWCMPNKKTFTIKPIRELLERHIDKSLTVIDPFANDNKNFATITNDIDPTFDTDYNMDALDFLKLFKEESVDIVLFDPPYSPRQVSECYKKLGRTVNMQTTQSSFWSNMKIELREFLNKVGKLYRLDGIHKASVNEEGLKLMKYYLFHMVGITMTLCV